MENLFNSLKNTLIQQGIVKRERTPIELMMYGLFLYGMNLSFRKTSKALEMVENYVSHVAIWKWEQKFGDRIKEQAFLFDISDVLIVDETKIKIGNGQWYLFFAICPKTWKIAYLRLSYDRSNLNTYLFFKQLIDLHGKPKLVITDGGPWYYWPLKRLGIRHEVVSGDVRNYVERAIEILKDRTRNFDNYFPCRCGRVEHINNWLYLFALQHNACFRKKGCSFHHFMVSIMRCLSC